MVAPTRVTVDAAAERELTADLARERLAAARPTVSASAALNELARSWAGQLAMAGVLSHDAKFASRIRSSLSCHLVAENVGVGAEASGIHSALMASASHRANLLEPTFTAVGVGAVRDQRGVLWIAQEFCAG
jgi:uncharacterized protein YkwD